MSIFETYLAKLAKTFSAPPQRTILSLDFESYSECDLKKEGASRYSRHPSTEVLMLAYATPTSEVKQWVPAHGEPMPDDLRRALADPSVTLCAWNAPFEAAIMANTLGIDIPIWRWLDVMALAYSLALPGSLDQCGKVVGLGDDKQKMARGKLLIRKFCVPRKPSKHKPHTRCTRETDPEEWAEFLEYNRRDVEAERSIYRRIKKFQMPDHEWDLWHLDQKINKAGIPINRAAVEAADRLRLETSKKDLAEMAEITGLANPNSGPQLLPWLREHGYWFEDLKKGHVERAANWFREAFEDGRAEMMGYDPAILPVLELRLRVSKSSVKKYPTLAAATDDDGVLRDCHQFAGAGRSWRWAGRRFQPQNLSKPAKYLEDKVPEVAHDIEHLSAEEMWAKYDDPDDPRHNTMEALVAGVRPMVQAPEGHLLVDADLSAIENVVLGWLADDDKILRVFRNDLDPYIDFAQDMFKMPYEAIAAEVKAGDKSKRTTAKPGVLGCGYMLGAGEARENPSTGEMEATGLLGYGWAMGVDLTPEMSKLSVDTFRAKFHRVVDFWYELDRACRRAITTKEPQTCGYLKIDVKGPFMRIRLPSGRFLHYWKPDLRDRKMPWTDRDGNAVYKKSITYEQVEMGQWRRVTTHPGKLTENCFAAGTPIVTARGVLPIEALRSDDLVWDGEQFVAHGGVVRSGVRETIDYGGVRVTPEHRIWSEEGWRYAGSYEHDKAASAYARHFGAAFGGAGGGLVGGHRREELVLERPLRLRTDYLAPRIGVEEGEAEVMRLSEVCADLRVANDARDVTASGILRLAEHDRQMHAADAPGEGQLRRARGHGLRALASLFLGLLGGHGADLRTRAVHRAEGQRTGVFPGQLSMGDPARAGGQPEEQHARPHAPWRDDGLGTLGEVGDRPDDAALSAECGSDRGRPAGAAGCSEPVYDVLNCGPRNRFTVAAPRGWFLAHNCTQAVARDLLAHGMTLADRRGLDLRLHIHDQAVAVAPEWRAERDLAVLIECLTTRPRWANSKMPLKAAGFTSPVFLKD